MIRRASAAVLIAAAVALGACSGDDAGSTSSVARSDVSSTPTVAAGEQPLRIDALDDAVAALETELGGPQRYFEVNATPTLVNLFVAGDGTATFYVYDAIAGTLGEPDPPQQASGETFTWDEVDFDEGAVLGQALAELPTAFPRTFAVTAGAAGALQYLVTLESSQGGVLDVLVAGDGTVIGAQARND